MSEALWGGRFSSSTDIDMLAFGASLPIDKRLWSEDIAGSLAHAKMLGRQGILSEDDVSAIVQGLESIADDLGNGNFEFYNIADEDIHMSIEAELTRRIGEAGKRLHTARSRNDQVACDTRLFCKRQSLALSKQVLELRQNLINCARNNIDVILPGYTHLQKAQPILFAHHMLAYQWMFTRDFERLQAATKAADVLVLGSAALAGTSYNLDRDFVAAELGFSEVSPNSLDAVSDRDFICDLIYACSLTMMHLSRLSEELVLWSSDEFGYITLSDAWSTGSSIMPQKKNPDFAELTRGKTGRVYGDLICILTVLKGLPLAYNKDLQEDKECLIDAIDTLSGCLIAVSGMITTMTVNSVRMLAASEGGFMAATDLADYLVGKGVAFRDAHAIIGRIVMFAEANSKTLSELTVAELHEFSDAFAEDISQIINIADVVSRRSSYGGTAQVRVAQQLHIAEQRIDLDLQQIV